MSTSRTIHWAGTVEKHGSSTRGKVHDQRTDLHLQIPLQGSPQIEQERVYPRPISRKEVRGPAIVDPTQRRLRAYTDRAPKLAEGESIDPTRQTIVSYVPSCAARSRGLSRSNAFRVDSPSSMEADRARILAFREAAVEREQKDNGNSIHESEQTVTLSRSKYNNRKRANTHLARQAAQTCGMTINGTTTGPRPHASTALGDGISGSSHCPRLQPEARHLPKLDTNAKVEYPTHSYRSKVPAKVPSHPIGVSRFREEFSP